MTLYKLHSELYGHSKDVRAVTEGPTANSIVSGSRDETVRLWQTGDSGHYSELKRLRGHEGFVTSVASFRPNAEYPNGLILSGGQDKKINVYQDGKAPELLYSLEGHTASVCSLAVDDETKTLVSGSWDSTARVWNGRECIAVLAGHAHTVWAVAVLSSSTTANAKPDGGSYQLPRILTGSADKKIICWVMGKPEHTFEGHTDCVRALAVASETEFLSASNDSTIRRWNVFTGECTMTYYGHENFIYSMSVLPTDKDLFVTTSEDGTAKIWRIATGENIQTLLFPTQTIWSVQCLTNGDIVTGSSDGVVRVFSSDAKRQAEPDLIATYDDTVQAFLNSLNSKDEIGGYKIADLPGKEALNEPAKKDGQTKMVRCGQKVELYKWTAANGEWEKMGDVMGAAKPTEGKTMYQGKEYDYVFDVDIEDGRPPLKLPYNMTEDPWVAAHQFLEKNMLPAAYIDQIVQFITTNAPNAGRGAPPAVHSDPFTGGARYVPGGDQAVNGASLAGLGDPFTGGGRYVPGGDRSTSGALAAGLGDPFTGSGRYVPGGVSSTTGPLADAKAIDPRRPRGEHMPLLEPIAFASASAESLLAKLIEFNKKQNEASLRLTDEQILLLEEFTSQSGSKNVKTSDGHLKAIERGLQWHKDHLVPILDLFRLAILNESVNAHFFANANAKRGRGLETVDYLCRLIPSVDSPPQFQILVCRSFANALAGGESGRRLLMGRECSTAVIPLIVQCLESAKPSAQVAAASALANLSCSYLVSTINSQNQDVTGTKIDAFRLFVESLKSARQGVDYGSLDQEAIFRLLQALVTCMWGDDAALAVGRVLKMAGLVPRLKDATNEEKSKAIARSIERMLSV